MFRVYSFITLIELYQKSISVKLLIDIITQRITFKIFIGILRLIYTFISLIDLWYSSIIIYHTNRYKALLKNYIKEIYRFIIVNYKHLYHL